VADAAASTEGLDRFIISALCNAKERSNGKYTWIYHFDSKAKIVEYTQRQYPNLAEKMSVVQVASYMDNWKNNLKIAKVC
jgi:argonaute-like protein implicated in RNA metabolism and viral defense